MEWSSSVSWSAGGVLLKVLLKPGVWQEEEEEEAVVVVVVMMVDQLFWPGVSVLEWQLWWNAV